MQGVILASRVPVGFIINEIREETWVQFKSVFTAYGMNRSKHQHLVTGWVTGTILRDLSRVLLFSS